MTKKVSKIATKRGHNEICIQIFYFPPSTFQRYRVTQFPKQTEWFNNFDTEPFNSGKRPFLHSKRWEGSYRLNEEIVNFYDHETNHKKWKLTKKKKHFKRSWRKKTHFKRFNNKPAFAFYKNTLELPTMGTLKGGAPYRKSSLDFFKLPCCS